ncbi:phosphotransferase [Lentzea sp. PSKA42]|uniref:Phosphotransferase n=1 Tax=Lentzea indica TaxID=2604800 RepID=A0ABX1FXV2_9PSEU|nr:phosphotransferase [Lentzea indica]NKE63902.1 phosphotransferase [Lentzea indica]
MTISPLPSLGRRLIAECGLASSHEPVDETLVVALLERHYHLGGRLERLATEKDDTFRLRTGTDDYLVKVSPPDEEAPVVALQTTVMLFLEHDAPDLPVQRVRPTIDGNASVVVESNASGTRILRVFGFVDGLVWAQSEPETHQLAEVGEMLGRIDLALATFTHPADRRMLVWDIQHFHHLGRLVAHTSNPGHRRLAQEVFRLFDEVVVPRLNELETQVIHGDFSPHNVVVNPYGDPFVTGVIDFGDTVRSAVIFDPAVPMANLLGRGRADPWQDARTFLEGYERIRPLEESELALLPVAALARLTLRALLTNWRAQHAPQRREYFLSHAKDDWINVEQAIAVPLDEVVTQLR